MVSTTHAFLWVDQLQILEAWCDKAKGLAESGLQLDVGSGDSLMRGQLDPLDAGGDGVLLLRRSLSQVCFVGVRLLCLRRLRERAAQWNSSINFLPKKR